VLAIAAWQRVLARGGVAVAVTCDRDCTLDASGRIALGRGRFAPLRAATRGLRARMPGVIVLRLPSRHFRAVRRALRRHGALRATVTATPAGGDPIEQRVRVR
jgi:hypothetical protein